MAQARQQREQQQREEQRQAQRQQARKAAIDEARGVLTHSTGLRVARTVGSVAVSAALVGAAYKTSTSTKSDKLASMAMLVAVILGDNLLGFIF